MEYKGIIQNSIMQKGQPATADSMMLEGFTAPLTATVIERLESAGVQIAGRIGASEFGASECQGDGSLDNKTGVCPLSYGTLSYGRIFNTSCQENRPPDTPDFALCNDYTGAISRSAAGQGLYYIHPTYGSVSRYGLIPSVSSMDQIGVLCKSPEVGFKVLGLIAGYDPRDGVMRDNKSQITNHKSKIREGKLQSTNYKAQIREGEFKSEYINIFPQIMQILCCAELSNNISRYDGIKFGYRAKGYGSLRELYTKSRTEAFGEDVKLAAVIGAMVLSQENYMRYYDKAMRLRRLIKDSLEFDKYDVIETGCPLLSRLCGLPSLSTPEKVYIADAGREDVLVAIGESVNGNERTAGEAL